jgi:predicted transcriptional regulator
LKYLSDRPYNANQLAIALNMDYKTIRHHLNVLIKNGVIARNNDAYIDLYYISRNIESDLNEVNQEIQYNRVLLHKQGRLNPKKWTGS